jgi:signal transduction histidine kinase
VILLRADVALAIGCGLLFGLGLPAEARAQTVVRHPYTELGSDLEVHEDPSGAETIREVAALAPDRFVALDGAQPSFGYSRAAHWLRGTLALPNEVDTYYLEHAFPETDDVRVYWPDDDGWREERSGDRLAFDARRVRAPTHVFEVPRARTVPFYVRIQSEGAVLAPLRVWRADAFERYRGDAQLLLGAFYAFLSALALYNLFLFFALRDRAYLFYVLYLASFALFTAAFEGHASMYLWPRWTVWAHVAGPTFLALTFGFGLLGLRSMASMPELTPRLARVTFGLALSFLALAPLSWVAYQPVVILLSSITLPVMLLHLVPLAITARKGWRPSLYLIIGHAFIFPGALLFALRATNLIERSLLSENAVKLGVAIEALVISFALADRIHRLREQRRLAQEALLGAQRAFGQRLLATQDAERRRLAKDLHDGLGQKLTLLASELARAEPADGSLEALARESIADARAMAYDLHPHALDRLGLSESVRSVARRTLEAAGIEPEIVVAEVDGLLDRAAELHLHRVLQEALANVVRHASAENVIVALRRVDDALELIVEDDGVGLQGASAPGLGTSSMRERADAIGGRLSIGAARDGGTRLCMRVPLAPAP